MTPRVPVLACALFLSATSASGQAPERMPLPAVPGKTFDLAWVGKIVRTSDPQISPDGKSLVTVLIRPDYERNLYLSELALVDVATGKARYLTFGRISASFPRWSPGGERVAFLAEDADRHNQVFVLDMAGGDAHQLTLSPTSIQQFAWRPDGAAIAYAAADEVKKKSGAEQYDDAFEVGNGSFLDREKAAPTHLWLAPANGGESKRLTSGSWSLPVGFPPGPPPAPIAFSADGRQLLYVRLESTYSGDRVNSSPQLLDLATCTSTPITSHAKYASFPVPSPDGRHVAYLYPRDGIERNYQDVYVTNGMAYDGSQGDGSNITQRLDHNFYRALWMPDSNAVLVGANVGATSGLWVQPLAGAAKRLELGNVTVSTGYWLDANVGPRGQVAFTGSEPHHPSEVYIVDSPNSKARRLTNFNKDFDGLALGRSEVVTWPGPDAAPKDWTENGILTFPPGYAPGRKLPLVLYIHGGPVSSSRDAFSIFAQLLAAQGWLVFEPNYRGSDNLGQDFRRAIVDDAGDGPGRDVLAGVEMLKRRGIVDETNIAVTGWSYGGYMTSWLIGHAQFWKTAIAGAPVTNLLDQYNLSDSNVSRALEIGGSPWTGDWMAHWVAQSPISYYASMVTPTLILQDVGDYRVTITQGYELYHALRDRGVPVTFIAYPVGGHSPADPVRMRDVYRRWVEWLGQYLPRG